MKFDGSSIKDAGDMGVVIISLAGVKTMLAFNLNFPCTNNQAVYKALIIGLEVLQEL